MGPAKRPRSRVEIRGKVLDVGRPRSPPEVTTAEQACEEPPFDVSWTRVRFPPPPQKSSAMRSFFVEAEGIEPSGWRAGRRSVERAAIAALSAVRSQHGSEDGPSPALAERTFSFCFFAVFFVFVEVEGIEPSGWRAGRRSVGRTAPAALSAVRSQHGSEDGPSPALAEGTFSFCFSAVLFFPFVEAESAQRPQR